ncbi:hypothetical protein [Methylorubrum extorquens]|uniref:Uncharacterized protein n=1 Tax=Methylorubrum extorquens (strain CM4 / NCIMB 13688) TaxID=440085 RepID=B7KWP0_METC4|nr:hypothetical protein [Methylorubrum extorquens]ACK86117.1 conserved hypothetical protein [Methylorubrum extorquens CM4]
MSVLDVLPLLAFLAPMPPIRPEPPSPPRMPDWFPAFIMGMTVFIMVAPMVAIWGFHRSERSFRSTCEAAGGQVVHTSPADDAVRCRRF